MPDSLKGLLGVLGAIVGWEVCRALGILPNDSAPSAWTIATTMVSEVRTGDLGTAILRTAQTWATGMLLTIAVGLPLGMLMGISGWSDAFFSTTFDFLRPVPSVAFVPVAVIFFGVGLRTELFLILLAAIWPIIYNVRFGIRSLDPLLLETARTLRLSRWQTLRMVRFPALVPSLFTGIRISASIAVILTIVAELVASGRGVGYYIELVRQNGLYAQAWAGLLVAGTFGYLVAVAVGWIERRVAAWHFNSKAVGA